MNKATRACIAYIAGRAISGGDTSHVYDYSQSRYAAFTGDIASGGVSVFDYERRCYCSGSLTQLYDYGNRAHIDLRIDGNRFSGYDYDSRKHFEGTVTGANVSIYDYETSAYYNYSL
ncbi:hypothetical protein [Cupriavidus plantarum]|uniref:hypothetical protein n=1 Tax=Cupriavidus plantarum TaxID=942865 RepID=UPI000E26E743|nr:hypothetical protein [Cupriavidus plantarum]REE92654.1 hypothetical protein C7418_3924 [Cupriavidus plantarum]